MNKKMIIILFSLLISLALSLSAVSAVDNNINDNSSISYDTTTNAEDLSNSKINNQISTTDKSFNDLQNEINNASNNVLNLENNYTYNNDTDSKLSKLTIIKGKTLIINGNGYVINGLNSIAGFYNEGTLTLNNLTISNCSSKNGGAIYNLATLTIDNLNISNCYGISNGGAIYNSATLKVNNLNILNCSSGSGGSIINKGTIIVDGKLNISNSNATSYSYGGGAIYNVGKFTVTDLIINNSTASSWGGAIYNDKKAYFTAINIIIEKSAATYGDAIYNLGNFNSCNANIKNAECAIFNKGNLAISSINIEDSSSINNSGVANISNLNCNCVIDNSNIFNLKNSNLNTSYYSNNGILYLNNSNIILENSTFNQYKNSAIIVSNSNLTIENSIFDRKNSKTTFVNITDNSNCNCNLNSNYWSKNFINDTDFKNANLIISEGIPVSPNNWVYLDIIGDKYVIVNDTTSYEVTFDKLHYANGTNLEFIATLPNYNMFYTNSFTVIDNVGNFNFTPNKAGYYNISIKSSFSREELVKTTIEALYKLNTTIDANNLVVTAYTSKNLVITLKDINANLLSNKTVTFTFNSKTYKAVTDENGKANLKVSSIYVKTYPVTITFEGDDRYNNSTNKVNVKVTPAYVTVSQIIKAANYVNKYVSKYGYIPSTVSINGVKYTKAQVSYLMTAAIKNIKTYSKKVKVINVKATNKKYKVNTKAYKKQYITIVNNLYTKANKGTLPTYIKVNYKKVGFNDYTYGLSRILGFYNSHKRLPNYVVFTSYY